MTPSCGTGAGVQRPTVPIGGGAGWLNEACLQGQPGQVGAPPASGFVANAVQVGADGAHADVQLGGDLGVRASLGDQDDQFPFAGAELRRSWRASCGSAAVSMMTNSAAVASVIAAPRCSAARVPAGPSACLASRSGCLAAVCVLRHIGDAVAFGSARPGPPTR